MPRQFTVRYRREYAGTTALLVEDEAGGAYLFSDGVLQAQLAGDRAVERLARLLQGSRAWRPVPAVAPYTLADLRRLCDDAATGAGRPPAGERQPEEAPRRDQVAGDAAAGARPRPAPPRRTAAALAAAAAGPTVPGAPAAPAGLDLTPREAALLRCLAATPGQPIAQGALIAAGWGDASAADAGALSYHIFQLRRKLAAHSGQSAPIATVRGVGYALSAACPLPAGVLPDHAAAS